MKPRLGATGALALAAASTGVVVPVLRLLVDEAGRGSVAAGVFMAAHVLGGVVAAALGARALQAAGSARRLAAAGLAASVAITLAMAAAGSFEVRVALRFADGACHLLAITALVAAATEGDPVRRARRAVTMGVAIVLGVAGGIGIGAALGRIHAALAPPSVALVVAALLSSAALVTVLAQVAAEPAPVAPPRQSVRGSVAPAVLAFGERFVFGIMTVASPYLASRARVGTVLAVFLVASVAALPLARRYALTWGARRLAVRSTAAFALALLFASAVDVFASLPIALAWSIACGGAGGALYASALVLVARSTELAHRLRDMAALHAAGNAGFALGNLSAGMLLAVLPGTLAIALPGVAVTVIASSVVWLTVPAEAAPQPVT